LLHVAGAPFGELALAGFSAGCHGVRNLLPSLKPEVIITADGTHASMPGRPNTMPQAAGATTMTASTIKRGDKSADVERWQRIIGATVDGDFGPGTEAKTRAWQAAHGLAVDGIVGPSSWAAAGASPSATSSPPTSPSAPAPGVHEAAGELPEHAPRFVRAKHFRAWVSSTPRQITHVVIHTAECSESPTGAEAVAAYFASIDRPASAHFCVDSDSAVQCVRLDDVAFAAPPLNDAGIHIELAGFAKQSAEEWADAYSSAEVERLARLVGPLAGGHGHVARVLDVDGGSFRSVGGNEAATGIVQVSPHVMADAAQSVDRLLVTDIFESLATRPVARPRLFGARGRFRSIGRTMARCARSPLPRFSSSPAILPTLQDRAAPAALRPRRPRRTRLRRRRTARRRPLA
jgi:hypothetical protein